MRFGSLEQPKVTLWMQLKTKLCLGRQSVKTKEIQTAFLDTNMSFMEQELRFLISFCKMDCVEWLEIIFIWQSDYLEKKV